MRKIICIGESCLDIVFEGERPVGAVTGSRIINAAAMLARLGLAVEVVSEAGADPAGDRVVKFLAEAGADTRCIDRFTEGRTPLQLYTDATGGGVDVTRYADYGPADFDVVWPRVDDSCIVVYGGYYAIDSRTRARMARFLDNCRERGALMVYLPGFLPGRESRITRVMPAILDNLETAHLVVARGEDLRLIFGIDSDARCYADNIDFYCRSMVSVDPACRHISYFSGHDVTSVEIPADTCLSLHWNAGIVAGLVSGIVASDLRPADLDTPGADIRRDLLTAAVASARAAAASLTESWQRKV